MHKQFIVFVFNQTEVLCVCVFDEHHGMKEQRNMDSIKITIIAETSFTQVK